MLVYDDVHNQMVNFTNSLLQFVSITESVTISEIFPKFLQREVKLLAGWLVGVGVPGIALSSPGPYQSLLSPTTSPLLSLSLQA